MPHGRPLIDKEWVQLAIDKSKTEDEYLDLIFRRVEWFQKVLGMKKYGKKLIYLARLRNPYRCRKYVLVEDKVAKDVIGELENLVKSRGFDMSILGELPFKPTRRKRCNKPIGHCEHTQRK